MDRYVVVSLVQKRTDVDFIVEPQSRITFDRPKSYEFAIYIQLIACVSGDADCERRRYLLVDKDCFAEMNKTPSGIGDILMEIGIPHP
jgi:hypothetical protein